MSQDNTLMQLIHRDLCSLRDDLQDGLGRIHERIDSETNKREALVVKVHNNAVGLAKVQVKTGVMSTVIGTIAGALGGLGLR